MLFRLALTLVFAVAPAPALAQTAATPPAAQPAAQAASGYMRVLSAEGNDRVDLEIASRTLVKPGAPDIVLVGVSHIGEAAYYDQLQTHLDTHSLVLFEGVKPAGGSGADPAAQSDDVRAESTRARLRTLAMLVERFRRDRGALPESMDQLVADLAGPAGRIAATLRTDAWGNPVLLSRAEPGASPEFDLTSLGSDGTSGGEGHAADLRFSDQPPLTGAERRGGGGLQDKLASALGLRFQLSAIDYTKPRWRNSDMSIDEVQRDLKALNAPSDAFFRLLDGSSLSGRLAQLILGVIQSNPTLSASARVMMIEVLANADALLERQPGGTGAMMKVLIEHRNQRVLDDLRAALAEPNDPPLTNVALFYGAGHMPDLQTRLEADGYTLDPARDRWFSAIHVSTKDHGLSPQQISGYREMIRRSMMAGAAPRE